MKYVPVCVFGFFAEAIKGKELKSLDSPSLVLSPLRMRENHIILARMGFNQQSTINYAYY